MKKSEIAMLLAYKHSLEGGSEPTEIEVAAWHDTIGDLDYQACLEAAREHYREAPLDGNGRAPRLMPRHLIEAVVEPWHGSSHAGDVTAQRLAAEARAAVTS